MDLWIAIHLPSPRPGNPHDATRVLLQYSPRLARLQENLLVLEVRASLDLFGGPWALSRKIITHLKTAGIAASMGMAPSALGAGMLARQPRGSQRRVLRVASLKRLLDPLALSCLPAALPHLDWLNAMGCHYLHQLAALPAAGLMQRSSPRLVQQLDAAYGKKPVRLAWHEAPECFHARLEASFHIQNSQAILTLAEHLIEQLCNWLQVRQWAADRLNFLLHHEKGRHARAPSRLSVRLSEPDWQASRFLSLLAEQLKQYRLPANVIALELCAVQGHPRSSVPEALFPGIQPASHREKQLLDLLRIRLGAQHVLRPSAQASHLPEQASQWLPALESKPPARMRETALPAGLARPFWLLDPPLMLATRHERPVYRGHALQLAYGPERLESGWWSDQGHQQRDYFIALDDLHHQYWIYRLRGTLNPKWFLHGLFA